MTIEPSGEPSHLPSTPPTTIVDTLTDSPSGIPTSLVTTSKGPSTPPSSGPSPRPSAHPSFALSSSPSFPRSSPLSSRPSLRPTFGKYLSENPSVPPSAKPTPDPSRPPSWKPTHAPTGLITARNECFVDLDCPDDPNKCVTGLCVTDSSLGISLCTNTTQNPPLKTAGERCRIDEDCCGSLECQKPTDKRGRPQFYGICREPSVCLAVNDPCFPSYANSNHDACCSGLVCKKQNQKQKKRMGTMTKTLQQWTCQRSRKMPPKKKSSSSEESDNSARSPKRPKRRGMMTKKEIFVKS